jgi:uncharacterized protein
MVKQIKKMMRKTNANIARAICITFLLVSFIPNTVLAKELAKNLSKHKPITTENKQASKIPADKDIAPTDEPASNKQATGTHETLALFDPSNQVEVNLDRPDALVIASIEQSSAALNNPADKLLKQGRQALINKDYAAALEAFQQAAAQGSANANAMLGKLYFQGLVANNLGATINDAKAFELFNKAALQHDADGQIGLSQMYAEGRGAAQDDELALHWLSLAAQQDSAEAQRRLGEIYQAGQGVEPNPVAAAAWFREAALKNEPQAQTALAISFREAQGVERDDIEAAWWFEKAAEQGNPQAQADLGMMYADGRGVHQDDTAAFKWFYQAAQQGNTLGLYRLGLSYAEGLGTDVDNVEAIRWFKKAADLGDEQAQDYLQQLGIL